MATIRIYGSSDDLVEIEGDIVGADEYSEYNNQHLKFLLKDSDSEDAVIIYVDCRDNETWTCTVGQVEEDVPIPAWDFKIVTDFETSTYSTILEIVLSDNCTVEKI